MNNYQTLKINVFEKICIVKVNRPEALNALNSQFFNEMRSFLGSLPVYTKQAAGKQTELNDKSGIDVLIITGEGKAFVAGADIAEMVDMSPSEGTEFSRKGQNVFRMIEQLEIPVIAAVNGYALGGGCELAMACDIRIASTNAKFGHPEVNLGLTPGYAGTQRLPRLIGPGNALYLLMSAEQINADEAFRTGLVQKVVEPEELMNVAMSVAGKIASKGPIAVKKVKAIVHKGLEIGFEKGSALESEEFGSLFENEGKEGMKAFLEKRSPEWQK
jgi:enoyl-CoA hydratase